MREDVRLNPRHPPPDLSQLPQLPHHTWIATSGTTGPPKFVALSKEALVASAEAVNDTFSVRASDIWASPLPPFHVGGIAVEIRCQLAGAKSRQLWQMKWDAKSVYDALEGATIVSLVPTQLWDWVHQELPPPPSLRLAIIGGARLTIPLGKRALALGWPLISTYGMTECASMIAWAEEPQALFTPLPHIQVTAEPHLCIQSPALLSYYWQNGQMWDPKENGWLTTADRGKVVNGKLEVHGRNSDFIKIGGEAVSLTNLQEIWDSVNPRFHGSIVACADERLGQVVGFASTQPPPESALEAFNLLVAPYAKIRKTHTLHPKGY